MAENRRNAPQDRPDALDEQFARPAVRPVATRTRVPRSSDAADDEGPSEPTRDREETAGGEPDREEAADREPDREGTADDDPIYPRTRVP